MRERAADFFVKAHVRIQAVALLMAELQRVAKETRAHEGAVAQIAASL
jgi:trans-2-enoyl-CoA reductase